MKVVVNRTRKKILSLQVDESGVLQVLANDKMSLEKIKSLVESKREWISEQLRKKSAAKDVEEKSAASVAECYPSTDGFSRKDIADMFAGRKCLFFGETLFVRPTVESKCYMEGNSVFIPEKYFATKETRLKTLKSYLKKLTVQSVSEEISKFGCNASLCPRKIEYRAVSNGWVKCTQPSEKIICLDFRVCQLPEKLQYYVIVHAFAHFRYGGHEGDFWNTVSNYLPRYKSLSEELRSYDFLREI